LLRSMCAPRYQIRESRGWQYLFLLEKTLQKEGKTKKPFLALPVRSATMKNRNSEPVQWTTVYAFRGTDERVLTLCPWEFWRFWDAVRLEAPCFYRTHALTTWTKAGWLKFSAREAGEEVEYIPGEDFETVSSFPDDGRECIALPRVVGALKDRMDVFRSTWVLRRSLRPNVLAPTSTPLPHKSQSKEQRARILSVCSGTAWESHGVAVSV